MAKLRIMTHNQWRFDNNRPEWEKIGCDCSAEVRAKGFSRVYKELLPDLIGCQEVSFKMLDCLLRDAKSANLNYAVVWGRETPILYNPEKFELLDCDFDLFPLTIDGFEGTFNNYQTKSWAVGVFRIKENGKTFIFANTHLWWMSSDPTHEYYQPHSDEARVHQLSIVNQVIERYYEKYACPVILAGDFNSNYHSPAMDYMLKNGFTHSHSLATDYADQTEGYHACGPFGFSTEYSNRTFEFAIDHLMLKHNDCIAVKRFERYSPPYYLPLSDHSPAFIDVEI